jgi:hypothetical protein
VKIIPSPISLNAGRENHPGPERSERQAPSQSPVRLNVELHDRPGPVTEPSRPKIELRHRLSEINVCKIVA